MEKINDLKKDRRKNFSTVHWFMGIIIFSLFLSSLLPIFGGTYEEVRVILATSSILFSIFVGFSISYLFTRFIDIRKLVAAETGIITNLFKFFETLNEKYADLMRRHIDGYLISVLDFNLYEHIEVVRKEYFNLFIPIKKLRAEKMHNANYVYNRSLALMHEYGNIRKQNIVSVRTKLTFYHWAILSILAFILVSILLYVREPTTFSIIFTALLIVAILTVLLVVKDLESLRWGAEVLWVNIYERVFDAIGMPRYYTQNMVNNGVKIHQNRDYRYVTYDPDNNKKIKLVKHKDS